jgi:hypothetical protein
MTASLFDERGRIRTHSLILTSFGLHLGQALQPMTGAVAKISFCTSAHFFQLAKHSYNAFLYILCIL